MDDNLSSLARDIGGARMPSGENVVCVTLVLGDGIPLFKRGAYKKVEPGQYSVMDEHVEAGEGWAEAAVRGLREEMGISVAEEELVPLGGGAEVYVDHYARVFRKAEKLGYAKYYMVSKPELTSKELTLSREAERMILLRPEKFREIIVMLNDSEKRALSKVEVPMERGLETLYRDSFVHLFVKGIYAGHGDAVLSAASRTAPKDGRLEGKAKTKTT